MGIEFQACVCIMTYDVFVLQGNMWQIFFHFIGSIMLSWCITENWNYKALWPIVITCNLPTALYEIGVLLAIYVFKTIVY